jgi:Mg/Co/Ni transporter MgtE
MTINLGTLLMIKGVPYDSDQGRGWAGALTAIMTGQAYAASAEIAAKTGAFSGFEANRQSMLKVMQKHRKAVEGIPGQTSVPKALFDAAREDWDRAVKLGEAHGYRNSQVTVLAPTNQAFQNLAEDQPELFKKLTPKKATEIITLMDPDEAVDVLLQFTPKKREALLKTLEHEKEAELRELMKLSETPVGHYMTTEFLTVSRDDVASLILRRIPSETDHMDFLDYVYVVNSKNQLIGVFNMHELLTQKKDTPVYKFMTADVIVAHLNSPLKLVFRKLIKYKISALPIVDVKKRILGIVTVDDIGEVFVENL